MIKIKAFKMPILKELLFLWFCCRKFPSFPLLLGNLKAILSNYFDQLGNLFRQKKKKFYQ